MKSDDEDRGRRPLNLPEPLESTMPFESSSGWGEYFWHRGWEDEILVDRLMLQTLTGALTCPLTTWASLAKFRATFSEEAHIDIHIIGAADTNEGAMLQSGWVWDELGEVMQGQSIHLSLIGPELSPSQKIELSDNLSATCHSAEYLPWRKQSKAPAASLALCFNSGLGTDIEMWRETLDCVLNEGTPLVCTSLDEADRDADITALDQLGAHRVTDENPFASALPILWSHRDQAAADRIVYSNAHCHVLTLPK